MNATTPQSAAARSVEFPIRVRTSNPNNGSRGNTKVAAAIRSREDASQRDTAKRATENALRNGFVRSDQLVPCVVTLTRISAGRLDPHDGLPAALKRVVDGIALALGIDDGGPFVTWRYRQVRGSSGFHAVRVLIERAS